MFRDKLLQRPWRAKNASVGSYVTGMLGKQERKVLYHIAKDCMSGEGDIVDLGAFCGASACCLAEGIRGNPFAKSTKIHSYDLFIANADYIINFIRNRMNRSITLGESFESIFYENIQPYLDIIEVHAGDILSKEYVGSREIECAFVDVAKTIQLNGHIVKTFFPHLIPGHSVIVHQDFFWPPAYWIAVTMWRLRDYVTLVEPRRDDTAVFLLEKSIPNDVLEEIAHYPYDFNTEFRAIQWMMEQMPDECEYLVPLAASLVRHHFGDKACKDYLEQNLKYSKNTDLKYLYYKLLWINPTIGASMIGQDIGKLTQQLQLPVANKQLQELERIHNSRFWKVWQVLRRVKKLVTGPFKPKTHAGQK